MIPRGNGSSEYAHSLTIASQRTGQLRMWTGRPRCLARSQRTGSAANKVPISIRNCPWLPTTKTLQPSTNRMVLWQSGTYICWNAQSLSSTLRCVPESTSGTSDACSNIAIYSPTCCLFHFHLSIQISYLGERIRDRYCSGTLVRNICPF